MFTAGAIIFMLLLAAAVLVKRRAKRSLSDDHKELIGSSEHNGWLLLVPAAVLGGALALAPHLIVKSHWLLPSLMVGVFAAAVGFSVLDVRRAARSGLPVDYIRYLRSLRLSEILGLAGLLVSLVTWLWFWP